MTSYATVLSCRSPIGWRWRRIQSACYWLSGRNPKFNRHLANMRPGAPPPQPIPPPIPRCQRLTKYFKFGYHRLRFTTNNTLVSTPSGFNWIGKITALGAARTPLRCPLRRLTVYPTQRPHWKQIWPAFVSTSKVGLESLPFYQPFTIPVLRSYYPSTTFYYPTTTFILSQYYAHPGLYCPSTMFLLSKYHVPTIPVPRSTIPVPRSCLVWFG